MSLTDQSPPWCSVNVLTKSSKTIDHDCKFVRHTNSLCQIRSKTQVKNDEWTHPKSNYDGIKVFRTSSGPPHPLPTHNHHYGHNNAIRNKSTSHDIVCKA